jgi:hypothetical protein
VIRKQFQVWHKDGDRFTHVANVRTGNLLGAMVFTLNPKGGHWQDNPEVEALVRDARNTTFGDRIVNPDGLAYSIHNFSGVGAGFREADSPAGDTQARFASLLHGQRSNRSDFGRLLDEAGERGKTQSREPERGGPER